MMVKSCRRKQHKPRNFKEFIHSKNSTEALSCLKESIFHKDQLQDLKLNMSSSRESSLEITEIDKKLNSSNIDEFNLSNSLISKKKFKDELTGEWVCPVCSTKLDSQHSFTVHIRQHNPTDHSHTCSICGKTLSSASSLDRHMLIHSGERPFKCKICNMAFTTNGNMHRHMRTHGMESAEQLNLEHNSHDNNHNLNTSNSNIHLSNVNKFKSKKRKTLEETQIKKKLLSNFDLTKSRPYSQADQNGYSKSVNFENKEIEKKWTCQVCDKKFIDKVSFYYHITTHQNEPLKCIDCGFSSARNTSFNEHKCLNGLNKHGPTEPHSVGFYDLTFTDFSSKKFSLIAKSFCEHNIRKSSSSYHEFECSKCERAFPCQSALNLHKSTHTNSTYCSICHCDLETPSLFISHQTKHRLDESTQPSDLFLSSKSNLNKVNGFYSPLTKNENKNISEKEGFLAMLQLHNKSWESMVKLSLKDQLNSEENHFDHPSYFLNATPSSTLKSIPKTLQNKKLGNESVEKTKHDLADIQSIISVISTATPLITNMRSLPLPNSNLSSIEAKTDVKNFHNLVQTVSSVDANFDLVSSKECSHEEKEYENYDEDNDDDNETNNNEKKKEKEKEKKNEENDKDEENEDEEDEEDEENEKDGKDEKDEKNDEDDENDENDENDEDEEVEGEVKEKEKEKKNEKEKEVREYNENGEEDDEGRAERERSEEERQLEHENEQEDDEDGINKESSYYNLDHFRLSKNKKGIANDHFKKSEDNKSLESFKCEICNLLFKSLNALKRHIRGHTKTSHSYACLICPYTSLDKSTLIRHLRTHNGERPFQCAICKYAFTTKANCERHVKKRHKKSSKIDIKNAMQYNSNMSTSSVGNLTIQNINSHNSILPIAENFSDSNKTVCKYCNVDFKFNRVLRHHLRSNHNSCNQKPYSCTICKIGFSTKNNCLRHVIRLHPELKECISSIVISNRSSISNNTGNNYCSSDSVTSNNNVLDLELGKKINFFNLNSTETSSLNTLVAAQQSHSSLAALCQIAGVMSPLQTHSPLNLASLREGFDCVGSDDYREDQPLDLVTNGENTDLNVNDEQNKAQENKNEAVNNFNRYVRNDCNGLSKIKKHFQEQNQPLDLALHALDLSLKSAKKTESMQNQSVQNLRLWSRNFTALRIP